MNRTITDHGCLQQRRLTGPGGAGVLTSRNRWRSGGIQTEGWGAAGDQRRGLECSTGRDGVTDVLAPCFGACALGRCVQCTLFCQALQQRSVAKG